VTPEPKRPAGRRHALRWLARFGLAGVLGLAAVAAGRPSRAETFGTAAGPPPTGLSVATFAGGCFWCMEPPFDALDGVVSTTSGYTGGGIARPSYGQVSAGGTGHLEAVRVIFDPAKVPYRRLLEVFWRNVDPLDGGGQFCDRGGQYRTAIFVHDAGQRRLAEASKAALAAEDRLNGRRIATEILDAAAFWPAEEYHQDYYRTNPVRYRLYRWNCGRDARLREVWGAGAGAAH
jgi:peptide-methionine (S)-S-oxide reductase